MGNDGEALVRAAFIVGAVVDAGAAIGMVVPGRFGARRRYLHPFDGSRPELAYGMRYGAPLMIGWTVLLLWGCWAPVERRALLLITVVPVIAGLMFNDWVAVTRGQLARGPARAIRTLQIGLIALFMAAYVASA
jgi:hypothetical protein